MAKSTIKFYRTEIILAVLLLITMFMGTAPGWIEVFYSSGIYIGVSRFTRLLFGWIPFSIGDILYGIALGYLLVYLFRFFRRLRRKQFNREWRIKRLLFLARLTMIVYIGFQWLWGLNYHRLGSAYQLRIKPGIYSKAELVRLTDTLNSRLVALIPKLTYQDSAKWLDFTDVATQAEKDYNDASVSFPFLQYRNPSVKQMLFGSIGGYGGFSGYLNPFTGEAQLNSHMPGFLRPYTSCHEIAHQLGYAAEEEANMAGYIVARQSANPAVRYSVYHDLLTYASHELYRLDSNSFNTLMTKIPPLVKQHSRQARDYFDRFKNPVQPVINQWYDLYLKANSQEKGVRSYTYVTAWLIAYGRKYGWDKI